MHEAQGAPRNYLNRKHDKQLSRQMLLNNTKILRMENDTNRLNISETLTIRDKNHVINIKKATVMQETSSYKVRCPCSKKWLKTIVDVAATNNVPYNTVQYLYAVE